MDNIKKIFLIGLFMMIILSLSAINATNDTADDKDTFEITHSVNCLEKDSSSANDKSITKPLKEKEIKTSTKHVEVHNYTELENTINEAVNDIDNDEYVINLNQGTYELSGNNMILSSGIATPNIIINANNESLKNGKSSRSIIFENGCNITINNANISHGIESHINLKITNSTIKSGRYYNYNTTIFDNVELTESLISFGGEGLFTFTNMKINSYLNGNGKNNLTIGTNVSFTDKALIAGFSKIYAEDMNTIIPYQSNYNGSYIIENFTFNYPQYRRYNYGNLTLKNCTVNSLENCGNLTLINCTLNGTIENRNDTWYQATLTITDDNIITDNFKYVGTGKFIGDKKVIGIYDGNIIIENKTISSKIEILETGNITLINSNITYQIVNKGNLSFINCSFSNNNMTVTTAKTDGFYLNNSGNVTIKSSVMENNIFNTTNYGVYGAINNNGIVHMINSTFNNNSIGYYYQAGGGNYYIGDYTILRGGTVYASNCNFTNNYAGRSVGVISCDNGIFINCLIENNTASTYGAIGVGANSKIIDCEFNSNKAIHGPSNTGISAQIYGTGALGIGDNSIVNNCTFNGNVARMINNDIMGVKCTGGALTLTNNCKVSNCLFYNNSANQGAAIDNGVYVLFAGEYNNNTVLNCTFMENTAKNNLDVSSIICIGGSSSLNLINNTFKNNFNSSYLIYDEVGEGTSTSYAEETTTHITNELITNNSFIDNNLKRGTLFSLEPDNITKTGNTYTNTSINDTIELNIPNKIFEGETIIITGTYNINNPQDYDENILEQNKFNVYINGVLSQTIDKLEFTITPTAGTMILTVQPTISQTRKSEAIKSNTLTNIIITPENYNEYIYEGNLIGVSKNTKILFNGTFNNKEDIFINTNDIIIDGTNATFTNTIFTLEATDIVFQNMDITNKETTYPIVNTGNNNIITNNTIRITNTMDKTATIYNTANNTEISHNTLIVDGPAYTIDYTSGYGVANTQAILLIGGDKNTIKYNNIQVTNTGTTSIYGTIEAITNHKQATNTQIEYNNITVSGNGKFNYAINTLSSVKNININSNNILVTGERYTAGIQAGNDAQNIIISNNIIKCICQNTTPVDEEAITYGIVTTSMGSGISDNITITQNNIDITGSVNYAIEVYATTNSIIESNIITVTGLQSMGIGYAHSSNSIVRKNIINTNGNSNISLRVVTEEIQPANVGIQIQQNSDNILIEENTIETYDKGAQDSCINVDANNITIKNNNLTSSTKTGTSTVNPQLDTVLDNNNAIQQESSTKTEEEITLGESTTLTASFYDDTYTPISSGKAIFRVNGKTLRDNQGNVIYADVINGRAELPDVNITQEWTKPDTTIQAVYVGDDNNEPITTTPTTINIVKPEATITLEAPTEATAGTTITLKVNVTDGDKQITSGRVAFKLNGKTLKDPKTGKTLYANVENGIATITYTIPEKTKAKEYTLTAIFTDTNYDRVEAESKLNVVKA